MLCVWCVGLYIESGEQREDLLGVKGGKLTHIRVN